MASDYDDYASAYVGGEVLKHYLKGDKLTVMEAVGAKCFACIRDGHAGSSPEECEHKDCPLDRFRDEGLIHLRDKIKADMLQEGGLYGRFVKPDPIDEGKRDN